VAATRAQVAATKRVDPIVGHAIEAWQALSPPSPAAWTTRPEITWTFRAQPVATSYFNHMIIPR